MAGSPHGRAAAPGRPSRWSTPVAVRRARIEIVPLIDVMFFLLASFMMVSLSLQRSGTFRMELPVATTAGRDFQSGLLNIGIEKDGRLSIEKRVLGMSELGALLQERFQSNPGLTVHVTADRAARHGDIRRVLAAIRQAGGLKVAFVTDGTHRVEDPATQGTPDGGGR